jgi:hypothetical protein
MPRVFPNGNTVTSDDRLSCPESKVRLAGRPRGRDLAEDRAMIRKAVKAPRWHPGSRAAVRPRVRCCLQLCRQRPPHAAPRRTVGALGLKDVRWRRPGCLVRCGAALPSWRRTSRGASLPSWRRTSVLRARAYVAVPKPPGLGAIVAALLTLAAAERRSQVQSAFTGKVVAVLDVDPRAPPPTGTR